MRTYDNFLVIHGCGGHARSVADVAIATSVRNLVFVDQHARTGERLFGFDVIKTFTPENFFDCRHIVAIGDADKRTEIFRALTQLGCTFASLVAPDASIGIEARLGFGIFVGRGAHIGPQASIGDNSIINTHALVEHESSVGNNCHIAVNATIAGRCAIGDRVMVGAGATVIDGTRICADVIVGAGAVVVKHIELPGTYIGIPAVRVPAKTP